MPLVGDGALTLALAYHSHHGLAGRSRVRLVPPRPGPRPLVLDDGFLEDERTSDRLRGRSLEGPSIHVLLPPDWSGARVDGALLARPADGRLTLPIDGPFHEVAALEVAKGPSNFVPFAPRVVDGGPFRLRFRLPRVAAGWLLLRGLGAARARLTIAGRSREVTVHSYRENLLSLAELGARPGDEVEVAIDRTLTGYLGARLSPTGQEIRVELERPVVFAPHALDVRRP